MNPASHNDTDTHGQTIKITVSDDRTGYRQCVLDYLHLQPSLRIVGEALDGPGMLDLTQRFRPDVAIVDIQMPALDGLEATRWIRRELPGVKVLVVSGSEDEAIVLSAIRSGANGYLLKTATAKVLVDAIWQVVAGKWPVDPVIDRLLGHWPSLPRVSEESSTLQATVLTPSEWEVLNLMAQGLTNREIAKALFVSLRTVQTWVSSIFSHLRAVSRLDAVLAAKRRGWIEGGFAIARQPARTAERQILVPRPSFTGVPLNVSSQTRP